MDWISGVDAHSHSPVEHGHRIGDEAITARLARSHQDARCLRGKSRLSGSFYLGVTIRISLICMQLLCGVLKIAHTASPLMLSSKSLHSVSLLLEHIE